MDDQVMCSIFLPEEIDVRLRQLSQQTGFSRSALIRMALSNLLSDIQEGKREVPKFIPRTDLPAMAIKPLSETQVSVLECKETCPYDRECANHESAGDFRTDDGLVPTLTKVEGGYHCDRNPKRTGGGAILSDGNQTNAWEVC